MATVQILLILSHKKEKIEGTVYYFTKTMRKFFSPSLSHREDEFDQVQSTPSTV
jgi:hypothetical protein